MIMQIIFLFDSIKMGKDAYSQYFGRSECLIYGDTITKINIFKNILHKKIPINEDFPHIPW